MTDRLRLNKGFDTSMYFSNRTVKTPLSSRRIDFPDTSESPSINPSKILQKYKHQHNKSQTYLLTQQKSKSKTNDYVKKIIFQNQELNKKIKQIMKYNKFIEKQNKHLEERYDDLKESFLQLKQLFQTMANENGIEITERYQLGNQKQLKLFNLLFKGIANLSSEDSRQQIISPIPSNLPTLNFQTLLNSKESQTKHNNKKQTSSLFRKPLITCQVQTQTDLVFPSLSALDQQSVGLSPSSNEAQLLLKISHLQSAITCLQKTNTQIITKYNRIKSIISGQIKSF